MGGLKGQDRTPAASTRVRRNATNLASEFSQVIGDGLTLSGAGIISVDIVTSGGLKFTSGQLEVDEANVDHDALNNFVANEHIDWTGTTENFETSGTMIVTNLGTFNSVVVDDLTLNTNVITSGTGEISLDNDSLTTTGTGHFATLSIDDTTLTPTSTVRFYLQDRYPAIVAASGASAQVVRLNE